MKKIIIIFLIILQNTFGVFPSYLRSQSISFARKCLLPGSREVIDSMFFTPDQSFVVKQVMLGLIDAEQEKIQCALFRLTDQDITQALIDAYHRGIAIELVVDHGALGLEYYSSVSALQSHGIDVYVYQPIELFSVNNNYGKQSSSLVARALRGYTSIMHHKTFIFYNSIGGSVITFGSLNPTHAAFNGNEEMVSVSSNQLFVDRWKKHFAKLQRRCIKSDCLR